jgi:hypothetical protein
MKKIIGIITFQLVLALSVSQVSAADAKDVAGVVVQTKRIPVLKNGKAGRPFVENTFVHNTDSGVNQGDATKLAESALKDDATRAPDENKGETLGILSTIGGVVSGAVGLVTSLISGKPILGGGLP